MRYVITGHEGFIGRKLKAELERRGHNCHGIDWNGRPSSDIAKPSFFRRMLKSAITGYGSVDGVIHLAAQPGRVFGERDKERTIYCNVQGTTQVASACGELGVRLIYTSTSEVYGDDAGELMVWEASRLRPKNLYGLTKMWGEQISHLYAPEDLLIVRPTMPYGPEMEVGYGRAALPTFIWNAIHRKSIPVHPGASRSWCYVDDMIRGFADVVEHGQGLSRHSDGIYNIGRDDDLRSMADIAILVCKVAGAPASLITTTPADATISLKKNISTTKLRGLGFEPQVDLETGMRLTYEWLLAQEGVEVDRGLSVA